MPSAVVGSWGCWGGPGGAPGGPPPGPGAGWLWRRGLGVTPPLGPDAGGGAHAAGRRGLLCQERDLGGWAVHRGPAGEALPGEGDLPHLGAGGAAAPPAGNGRPGRGGAAAGHPVSSFPASPRRCPFSPALGSAGDSPPRCCPRGPWEPVRGEPRPAWRCLWACDGTVPLARLQGVCELPPAARSCASWATSLPARQAGRPALVAGRRAALRPFDPARVPPPRLAGGSSASLRMPWREWCSV